MKVVNLDHIGTVSNSEYICIVVSHNGTITKISGNDFEQPSHNLEKIRGMQISDVFCTANTPQEVREVLMSARWSRPVFHSLT